MANRTVKDAHSIHGTNPQYLVEKIDPSWACSLFG